MALYCEMISQPHAPLCKTTSWHTSAISQPHTLISQLRNGCEISKALKFQFSQPKPHFAGCFAAAKHPFGTRMPFCSRSTPFRSYEMGCENSLPLRNPPPAAKMLQVSEMGCEIPILLPNDFQTSKWL